MDKTRMSLNIFLSYLGKYVCITIRDLDFILDVHLKIITCPLTPFMICFKIIQ